MSCLASSYLAVAVDGVAFTMILNGNRFALHTAITDCTVRAQCNLTRHEVLHEEHHKARLCIIAVLNGHAQWERHRITLSVAYRMVLEQGHGTTGETIHADTRLFLLIELFIKVDFIYHDTTFAAVLIVIITIAKERINEFIIRSESLKNTTTLVTQYTFDGCARNEKRYGFVFPCLFKDGFDKYRIF